MNKLLVLNLLVVSAQFYDTTVFYNKRAMPGQIEPELVEVRNEVEMLPTKETSSCHCKVAF